MKSQDQVSLDDVHVLIGHAAASVIESGKILCAESILSQLRQSEEEAVDGMKTTYALAIELVSGSDKDLSG